MSCPCTDKIEVKRGASDDEVTQALEGAGKLKDMHRKSRVILNFNYLKLLFLTTN